MNLISLLAAFAFVQESNSVTYLRAKNDRGPSATKSGVDCLEQVERSFFKNLFSEQVENLAVFHSKSMSSPAMEIETEYLFGLHDRILNQEDDEESFQLKVISDTERFQPKRPYNDITLTDFYVIVADTMETLQQTIKSISSTQSFNEDAKFLILVNNPKQRTGGDDLAWQTLDFLFVKYRAINVVVMFGTDAFSYDIYTGDPYNDDVECGKMRTLNIGKCSNGILADKNFTRTLLNADKVPAKMPNCLFNFCARVQEPFVNAGCRSGLEIQIMNFLKTEMHFEIKTTCTEMERGEINDDGTWSDLLGAVKADACDIIAGAFFPDFEVHMQFAATEFYFQDFYTFYIDKASFAPRWKGLITIFKVRAWMAFGVVLIISWISWFVLGIISGESRQHRQILLTFMNVWAVSLGITANNRPDKSTLRMFFSFFALYALTITAIYTSKLITVFTNPRYDYQIDSIEEILESDLMIGGRLETMDFFENEDALDQEVFKRYNHSAEFRPSPRNLQRVENGQIALLMSRLYVSSSKQRNDVFGLTQSMFSNHLEMIVERGFPLLRRINRILASMRDMGFMRKFFVDFHYNMTILTAIRELKARLRANNPEPIEDDFEITEDQNEKPQDDPEIVLTVEHLQGAFTVHLMGLIVSASVFLLEQIYHSKVFRRFVLFLRQKMCFGKKTKGTQVRLVIPMNKTMGIITK